MMASAEAITRGLQRLGLAVEPPAPKGRYAAAKTGGGLIFTAGNFRAVKIASSAARCTANTSSTGADRRQSSVQGAAWPPPLRFFRREPPLLASCKCGAL